MLNLYQSNKLDALMTLFLHLHETQKPSDPLTPLSLLAPSRGMQRWMQFELAKVNGIAANIDFKLPASFLWQLINDNLEKVTGRSTFDPDTLAWRILALLPQIPSLQKSAIAANWQAADDAGKYELSWRIGDVFDQYLIYRPDWLDAWEKGKLLGLGNDEAWQAELWQLLVKGEGRHRARLMTELEQALEKGKVKNLPERLTIFGVSTLPLRFLNVLELLGKQIEVDLFVLNPSSDYWGQLRRKDANAEGSHPLLASLGQQGRDFIHAVSASSAIEPLESALFISPADGDNQGTLLATLQSDILHQTTRAKDERIEVNDNDDSFVVHSCHSAMREVEVLHDQLLALFQKHPDLQLDDVLVMCTDIQHYAPFIEAVFASRTEPAAIPFTIADRRLETEQPLLQRVATLLSLSGSRFEVEDVLALLEEPALQKKFGLSENDIPMIRRWCGEMQLRWGRDQHDRQKLNLPTDVPFTWRDALARLQLGFALPLQQDALHDGSFAGRMPGEAVFTGSQAQVLARFTLFIEKLFAWEAVLQQSFSLAEWAKKLEKLFADFFDEVDESKEALQHLREATALLAEQANNVTEISQQPFKVIKRWITRQLSIMESRRGFLHGKVTFCAMVPMRSLPFRFIAVLGMDDGVFPRPQKPWPFDLMKDHPRSGDRSRRQDDRYLFLEILLAAKDWCYLSYIGQSERDGSIRPPSPVLAEVLDQVRATVAIDEEKAFSERFIIRHPLQPFSTRYYEGNKKLFSFNQDFAAASQLVGGNKAVNEAVASTVPLPPLSQGELVFTPAQFERFLSHPGRYFLRERLGVQLYLAEEELDATEPVELTDFRALRSAMFNHPEQGVDSLRAMGFIPSGVWGNEHYRNEAEFVAGIRKTAADLLSKKMEPVTVDLDIGGVRINGMLEGLTSDGLVRVSLENTIYPTDILCAYFAHLLLCVVRPEGVAPKSHLIGKTVITMEEVKREQAITQLSDFAAAAIYGMSSPLPLFRKSSPVVITKYQANIAYDTLTEESKERMRREIASKQWFGDDYNQGDSENAWNQLLWKNADPIDNEFLAWSVKLYGGISHYLKESK